MSFAGAEADRRIANLVRIARVTAVYGDGTARVESDGLATHPLPVAKLRAGAMQVWWMPSVGEQVLIAAPSGDMARAVIVCSILASNAPSSDVATPVIDLHGGQMILRGELTIEGTLHVTGDITCDADTIASGISLTTHVHGGVAVGGATTAGPQ